MDHDIFRRELFLRYNEKYDSLNDELESLALLEARVQTDPNYSSLEEAWDAAFEEPTEKSKSVASAYDYLNLCAEEYYWFKKDFVDADVWKCWKKGMLDWHRDLFFLQRIVSMEKEKGAAYYNDDFLSLFPDTQ